MYKRQLMKGHRAILEPKFRLCELMLEENVGDLGIAEWNKPNGGYFISVDVLDGCAKRVVQLCNCLLYTSRHNVFDDVLDHGLHEIHVVVEIGKRNLRLDHPELCRVTLCVGALCAERGAERIDLTERHSHALRLKLAGNGEGCLLAEEILAVICLLYTSVANFSAAQRQTMCAADL